MTLHEQLYAQAREVLMQDRAVDAVYLGADNVNVACRVIRYPSAVARTGGGQQAASQKQERMVIELPQDPAEGGVATLDTAGQFLIDGKTWGIEALPSGPPGMHRVELFASLRAPTAGRR